MTHYSPTDRTLTAKDTAKLQRLPPDERFWKRYSPKHELPLSGMVSLFVHSLAIGLLLLAVIALAQIGGGGGDRLPTLGTMAVEGTPDGAGNGTDGAPGRLPITEPREAVPAQVERQEESRPIESKEPLLPVPPSKNVEFVPPREPETPTLRAGGNNAVANLDKVARDAKQLKSMGEPNGTPGQPGGAAGAGNLQSNPTTRRQLRWTLVFDTRDGPDYLRQLKALGAILAIPQADGRYLVVRNLKAPARGKVEDLRQFTGLRWMDDKPQSVQSLALALGLPQPPRHIIAFFPDKLEQEMLRKELAFAGRKEEAIQETRFHLAQSAKGVEPKVVSQEPVP